MEKSSQAQLQVEFCWEINLQSTTQAWAKLSRQNRWVEEQKFRFWVFYFR